MQMEVARDGGKRVSTRIGNHRIVTDQPVEGGGEHAATAPFDLLPASLATAAFLVPSHCRRRQIDTSRISVTLASRREPGSKTLRNIPGAVVTTIGVPAHLPDQLHQTLWRVARQCPLAKTAEAGPALTLAAKTRDG